MSQEVAGSGVISAAQLSKGRARRTIKTSSIFVKRRSSLSSRDSIRQSAQHAYPSEQHQKAPWPRFGRSRSCRKAQKASRWSCKLIQLHFCSFDQIADNVKRVSPVVSTTTVPTWTSTTLVTSVRLVCVTSTTPRTRTGSPSSTSTR